MLNFRKKRKVRWEDVANFQIDAPKAVKKFTDKLFEEYAWNPMFSKMVIEEYKKFMFLIASNPNENFTPSKYVDKVWHLHLQYTKNYWKEFCVLLGREIHHHPGDGSPVKEETFRKDYLKTLRVYEETFGHPAPEHVWGRPEKKTATTTAHKKSTVVAACVIPLLMLSIGGLTVFLILLGIVGLALIIYALVSYFTSDSKPEKSSRYTDYTTNYSSKKKRKNSGGSNSNSSDGIFSACSSCSSGSHSDSGSSHSDSGFGGGDSDGGGSSGDSGGSSCGSSCGGGCGGGD